jgi:hypothetical protein
MQDNIVHAFVGKSSYEPIKYLIQRFPKKTIPLFLERNQHKESALMKAFKRNRTEIAQLIWENMVKSNHLITSGKYQLLFGLFPNIFQILCFCFCLDVVNS